MPLDQYSTHVGPLAAAMMIAPPGDVLECGAGGYSTPLLHAMCKISGRNLQTIDSNPKWAEQLKSYAVGTHKLNVEPVEQSVPMIRARQWALAFVDNGQFERKPCLDALVGRAALIVVHDTERPELYAYEPLLSTFKYRADLVTRPWVVKTSIVSNTIDLARLRDLWK